ncbi:mechanosensitive ion channel family protein [Marinobacter nanhaiticus D15-8W]|uniref:Small-conductance mechanosensitive channel n=1 Tax=Marinobacter nanhaiticus D15-8W TaxID=626887 RepID=A0A371CGA8_9GAMM|nr:mechanosensitive ion channel domain-containing protein [Marinobacter nanhaiticus]RDW95437.1 mechanosensitive ion channel family protein [Marinobacter nanhaiticus D15-8W]BES69429.1 mechanosensitive ion channel family protein [Marinobacter nanhaiticus D15-8W]
MANNASNILLRMSLAILLSASAVVSAQDANTDLSQVSAAPVMLDGDPLFSLAGTASFPAEERAANVAKRIRTAAADSAITADDIQATPLEGRILIKAGNQPLVAVFPLDASTEGAPLDEVSNVFLLRIRNAVEQYRARRTTDYLFKASLLAGAALVVTAGLVWLTVILFRRLFAFLDSHYKRMVQDVKIESFEVVRADNIWNLVTGLLRFARLATVLIIAYLGIEFILYRFPWTRGTANILLDVVVEPVTTIISAFLDYLPELVFLIILIAVARYALKLLHLFFRGVEHGRVHIGGFEQEWAQPTYKLLRFFIILLTVVLAYPYIPGSGSAAFQGLSLLLGIMVSLGASSAVSSIVAGYAMTYRRAFRIGDLVVIGEHTGVVREMRLLVTHLRTFHNEEIVLPNSLILNSPVTNLTRSAEENGLLLKATVGIGYETPWRQVEAMLKEAAAAPRA